MRVIDTWVTSGGCRGARHSSEVSREGSENLVTGFLSSSVGVRGARHEVESSHVLMGVMGFLLLLVVRVTGGRLWLMVVTGEALGKVVMVFI